ncbi:DUF3106 domain-containing protein [Granulicella sp. 5B5]|uniref:DUF3106 domain-containing protein n=1 Tax=Granulicella sp. 5B5 TaxID=1617967 RepID=UPI0015F37C5C|nr:DUF3106 domain-containing protein [Granulicella sp. 5B5]
MMPTRLFAALSVIVALCLAAPQGAAGQRMRARAWAGRMAPVGYYQRGGQRMQPRMAARQPRPPAQQNRRFGQGMGANHQPGAKGEHLAEWMNAHRNLTPMQQQQALGNEPGFRDLPQQTQQRYRERLAQLNAMDPARRAEILKLNEHMEGLSLQQRGQVRGAMQQLGSLPPDQRHVVARSFNELRRLPPDQRAGAMSRIPLNDAQRSALNHLMTVEPMLPQ